MTEKLQVSVLCGGQSAEHEISLLSANNIIQSLDQNQYEVSVIYITQQGQWRLIKNPLAVLQNGPEALAHKSFSQPIALMLGEGKRPWMTLENPREYHAADVVIPVMHGTLGEDGTLQGLLEMLKIAYVGCGVLSSALCMNKAMTKQVIRAAGIPTADWVTLNCFDTSHHNYTAIANKLGKTLFLKPVSLGSSIGISKVNNATSFTHALHEAFRYDDTVLVEPHIKGREIECSLLGNENPIVSLPGEVVTHHDFYSYEAKYLDPHGAEVITPADLSREIVSRIQAIALNTYRTLQCEGMARVDFFLTDTQDIFVNEVNPIPGFTDISLYPKNWQVSGVTTAKLLDDLIQLALARHQRRGVLSRVRLVESSEPDVSRW